MASLLPIEALGYDRAFFKLPPIEEEEQRFRYFTYEDNLRSRQLSYWDLMGLRQAGKGHELLDIQLLHIDEELLDWEEFEALHDAGNYLSLTPPTVQGVIHFLEALLPTTPLLSGDSTLAHFHRLTKEESGLMHLAAWRIDWGVGRYYQYLPDAYVQPANDLSLLWLPHWSSRYGMAQQTSLGFATFERQRLDDPEFDPFNVPEWLGQMTFDQQALSEFVALLKQHSYEQFVTDAHSA